jgi:transcription elongation factor Elf1
MEGGVMSKLPSIATCLLCHSEELTLVMNLNQGPMLQCDDCGFTRRAEAVDMFQDFNICA